MRKVGFLVQINIQGIENVLHFVLIFHGYDIKRQMFKKIKFTCRVICKICIKKQILLITFKDRKRLPKTEGGRGKW